MSGVNILKILSSFLKNPRDHSLFLYFLSLAQVFPPMLQLFKINDEGITCCLLSFPVCDWV